MDALRYEITTTAGGAATVATGNLNGFLWGFAVVLGTATSFDLTLADTNNLTLYSKAGLNASAIHAVAKNQVDTSGASIVGVYTLLPVVGSVTITIANGGATTTLSIILFIAN